MLLVCLLHKADSHRVETFMDPVTLATVTAAVSVLATECAKGIASSAGKDLWGKIKSLFGWQSEPQPSELAGSIASELQKDPRRAGEVLALLKQVGSANSFSASLVDKIDAEKVIAAQQINVAGDLNM
jgi:hypothetical protein